MKQAMIDLNQFPEFDAEFVAAPGGTYLPVNVRGDIAYVAIQFPIDRNGFHCQGILGASLSTEDGNRAAAKAALNVLAQVNRFVGFENVEGLNHFEMYYRADPEWDDAPKVADSASTIFIKALGPKGVHTRAVFGVHALPRRFSVGITASFTLFSQ